MKLHKNTLRLGIALALSLSPLSATPDTWQKHIQEISEQVKINPDKARPNQAQIDTCLRTIKMAIAAEDYNQAISQLNNLRAMEPKAVAPILKLSEQLIDALVDQSKKEIIRKEKLYQKFAASIINTKLPEEIDPWLVKLNAEVKKAQTRNRPITPLQLWTPIRDNSSHLEGYANFNRQNQLFNLNTSSLVYLQSQSSQALQIAHYWQDYLQYKLDGDSSSARSSMSRISQVVVNFTYIPRSKVLALQSELGTRHSTQNQHDPYRLLELKKRISNQQDALLLYAELRNASSNLKPPAVRDFTDRLSKYSRACEYLDGGDISNGFYELKSLMFHPILGELSQITHDKYLERYLDIPGNFKKKQNEDTMEWATRYLLTLSKEKSWSELNSTLRFFQQYYSRADGSGRAPIKEDVKALNYFLLGKKYESNQQYMRAITAYRQALGTLGYCEEVTTEAGNRLLRLQKAHPIAFAQSQSLHSHNGTSHSFSTSHILLRKIVKEELKKSAEKKEQ